MAFARVPYGVRCSVRAHRCPPGVLAGAAVVGNTLVVADRKPVVTFIDTGTGEVLNRVPLEGVGTVRADVVAADGSAYILTTKGRLFRASPETRQVVEVPVTGVKK